MVDSPLFEDDQNRTVLSADGVYRYRLWRTWDAEKPTLAFLILNPSTADATEDDPTIRRCLGFAKEWGYGSLVVGNLFALRSPNPATLRETADPVGPENDDHLQAVCEEAKMVVAAWGANGSLQGRASEVIGLLGVDFHAFDTTKAGHPVHPLYQPADPDLIPWSADDLES